MQKKQTANSSFESLLPPQANALCLGHEALAKRTQDAFYSNRFPHAWLLSGEKGIGKATFAYRMARFILYQSERAIKQDKTAPASDETYLAIPRQSITFQRVAASSHPNLRLLKREEDPKTGKLKQFISVDDVRKISNFLHMTPGERGWRVILVDSVDDFNRNSANSILKHLEEPPERTVFLLVCHHPAQVLPTIRSRCAALTFQPLKNSVLEDLLNRYNADLSLEDRQVLARLGEGSIGRALSLASNGGASVYSEFIAFLKTPAQNVPSQMHKLANLVSEDKSGEVFQHFSVLVNSWLTRLIRAKATQSSFKPVLDEESDIASEILTRSDLLDLVNKWESVKNDFAKAHFANLDKKQSLLSILSKLAC